MKFQARTLTLALFAALALHTAAHADVTVQPEQLQQLKPGMTAEQLQATLGRPARDVRYALSGLRSWTYVIPGGQEQLELDFGADGRVQTVRVSSTWLP